jgi:hypothetical protein
MTCAIFQCWKPDSPNLRSLNTHHFGMVESYRINDYGIEVIFSGVTFLLNFMRIH